jgi:tRNA dimethylallyltransferase
MKTNTVNKKTNKKVIAIVGPTGSGKSSWAKTISKKYDAKIISVDSRQIYKGMDIGTGKDKSFHQDLIDVVSPDETYSVAKFQKSAHGLINQYMIANNFPILVGGTGLYLESVLYGYVLPELKNNGLKIRYSLEKLTDNELLEKLKKIDPRAYINIDHNNRRRIIRAIEVSLITGKPFSSQKRKRKPLFDVLILGIKTDRDTLYSKIDARVEQMIKDGLVEEVRELVSKYGKNKEALNTIGYKEIIDYLDGKITLKEAIEKIKTNTHAYVRRQETWFRRDKNIKWISTVSEAEKEINKFLKK